MKSLGDKITDLAALHIHLCAWYRRGRAAFGTVPKVKYLLGGRGDGALRHVVQAPKKSAARISVLVALSWTSLRPTYTYSENCPGDAIGILSECAAAQLVTFKVYLLAE